MRILLVNKYWRRQGGVEEYCFMLKKVLEDLGHEVVPFAQLENETLPTPWSQYFVTPVDPTASGLNERLRTARRAVLGDETRRAVSRLLDDVQIDAAHVVHTYHQLGPMFMRELAAREIPTLLSIHDYKLCCPSYRLFNDTTEKLCTICLDDPKRRLSAPATTRCWRGSRAGGALLAAEAAAVRLARPYHAASQVLVSNELMKRCALSAGIRADALHTVPNFWPAADSPPSETDARHVLFVGRLVVEKGVDVALRAAARSGVTLRIVGDGPLRSDLERLARELDAPAEFVGPLWGDEVEKEMRSASALVVPSVWHEVSPLVIYQAMTLGVPVIASNVGGIPDLIGQGRGTLVPGGDVEALAARLSDLLSDGSPFRAGARAAYDYSLAELSRDRFIERVVRAYGAAGVTL